MQSPDDDDNLSPPPDSIDDQVLEDQIVVGKGDAAVANANANVDGSTSAKAKVACADEMDMDGDENDPDPIKSTRVPKRKRTSLYEDLAEEKMDSGAFLEDKDEEDTVASTPASDINGSLIIPKEAAKPILLGIWRDSEAPDPDQHIVKGFIDSRDRLRTRIQQVNRAGDNVTGRFPLKPGPGGSWVTFHNIIFDEHLVHLDQHQVKEYVKLRSAMQDEPGEDPKANDKLAVQKAIKACSSRGPLPEGALPPLIAYGANIPEHARISYSRAEKRRRTAAAIGAQGTHDISPVVPQQLLQAGPGPVFAQAMQLAPHPPISVDLPGKRPTRVVLGYWNESAEPRLEDKHAVFGILGSNDMFRVKVGRETRDGRPVTSNFPQGAGALWINAHQWQRETYLEDLSREELKEFTRVRQCQIDLGEHDEDHRHANIEYALGESRRRAAYLGSHKKNQNHNTHVVPANNHFMDMSHMPQAGSMPVHETRQNIRRGGPPAINPATSFHHQEQALGPGAGFRAANRGNAMPPPLSTDPRLQRAESLASNAVSRIEANQAKVEQRDAQLVNSFTIEEEKFPGSGSLNNNSIHGSLLPVGQAGDAFRDNLGRLNNVWSQQEAQRIRSGNEDAKMHMSIKYERKATGPFAGKLVSQGNIISIDGEDYVEYRVLTKPSFI